MDDEKDRTKLKRTIQYDSYDSTRPVDKLVTHFMANKKATLFFNILQGRVRTTASKAHNAFIDHPTSTFPEDWDGVLPTNFVRPLEYKFTSAIAISPICHVDFQDPVTSMLKMKHEWTKKKFRLRNAIHKSETKSELVAEDIIRIPTQVLLAATALEKNPDPYPFLYDYSNWLYNGHGNMHVIDYGGKKYVLHCQLTRLYWTKLNVEKIKIAKRHVAEFDCGKGNNIMELINSENIVALRTIYRVFILKMVDDDIGFEKLENIESDVPLSGISFDPHQKYIMYIRAIDDNLTIVNTHLMKGRTVKLTKSKTTKDNWGSVIGLEVDTYANVSKNCINTYDKRTNNVVFTWRKPPKMSDFCNKFTVARKVENTPYLYVATNHDIFLADDRYNSTQKPTFLQKWGHQMYVLPSYLSVTRLESNKDFIFMSSQWLEDRYVFLNDSNSFFEGKYPTEVNVPYAPPTIADSLSAAHLKKMCIDIYNRIDNRVYTSITGIAFVKNDDNHLLLRQNSLGDIFCNTMYPANLNVDIDDGINRLHKWTSSYKEPTKVYEVSDVISIHKVWKGLKKVPDSYTFGTGPFYRDEEFKFSDKEIMETFETDQLDPTLLDEWLIDKEDVPVNQSALGIDVHFSDSE